MLPTEPIIIVFGGARGIGLSLVASLIQSPCKVLVADQQGFEYPDPNGRVAWYHCDVSNPDQVGRVIRKAVTLQEQNDTYRFVSVANTTAYIPKSDTPTEWRKAYEVNVLAASNLTQHAAEALMAYAPCSPPFGRIVHTGSVSAFGVRPSDSIAYASSKAALHHLVKAYAVRYPNLAINAVAPSMVTTGQFLSQKSMSIEEADSHPRYGGTHISRRVPRPEEVSAVMAWLLCSAPSSITGSIIPIDSGYSFTLEKGNLHA